MFKFWTEFSISSWKKVRGCVIMYLLVRYSISCAFELSNEVSFTSVSFLEGDYKAPGL